MQYIAFVRPVTVVGQCALPTLREGGAVFCFSRFHVHVQRRLLPHRGQTKPQHRFLGCYPRAGVQIGIVLELSAVPILAWSGVGCLDFCMCCVLSQFIVQPWGWRNTGKTMTGLRPPRYTA